MALPAHLAKYDSLLDFLVEALVRETEMDTRIATAPGLTSRARVNHHEGVEDAEPIGGRDHTRDGTCTAISG